MNIAIILGVSEYSDPKNNLPGCKNDAESINNILIKTGKFSNILYINENKTSAQIKDLIANFISSHKQHQIEDLFFYYTGHGEFVNDEFYYILPDFDSKKRNQTSLQNTEIDDLIRNLSPELLVKVIDACQSGTTYIKDANVLNKYFNDRKKIFNKCYFLNSSLNNQSSYQDSNLSFFTSSFIKALKNHSSAEIRYKDIIDVLADDFIEINEQTPFFVIQADYTEKFCVLNADLRVYLDSINNTESAEENKKPLSFIDIIKTDASEYVNKDGALLLVESIREHLNSFSLNNDLDQLYNIDINYYNDYKHIYAKKVIETWISQNKGEYFVKSSYTDDYDEYGNEYAVLEGFELNIDLPFNAITIDSYSKYPNLKNYNTAIIFLLSKRLIRFFYYTTDYIDETWDIKEINKKGIQWITNEFKIKDKNSILSGLESIKSSIQARIMADLQERFDLTNKLNLQEDDTTATQEESS